MHSITLNKYSPKKREFNHMVGTAYLRDEPDLRKLAQAISLMVDQLLAEKRKHQNEDAEPSARAA